MMEPHNEDFKVLYDLMVQLRHEADKLQKHIELKLKKAKCVVDQAECVQSSAMRTKVKERAVEILRGLVEGLIDVNVNLEFEDNELLEMGIPYPPVGEEGSSRFKFSSGDNPWNFWLVDQTVDTKALYRTLLKKYQRDLLEPFPSPKPLDFVCFYDRSKVLRGIVQSAHENRIKILDCDSNVTKLVACDRVYKVDPDACSVQASVIKCTILKNSEGVKFWTTDLRDIFCNALKEAALEVKILEMFPSPLPIFRVQVKMTNEEEGYVGDLEQWITVRLLPELKKVPASEGECVLDFLTYEALNPYGKDDLTELCVCNKEQNLICESHASLSDEDNNVNANTDKVSTKIVAKVMDTHTSTEVQANSSSKQSNELSHKKLNNHIKIEPVQNKSNVTPGKDSVQDHDTKVMSPNDFVQNEIIATPLGDSLQKKHTRILNQAGYIVNYPVLFGPPEMQLPSIVPQCSPQKPLYPHKVRDHNYHPGNSVLSANLNASNQKHNDGNIPTVKNETNHVLLKKPSTLLKPGEILLVIISYVASPAEFYIHFVNKSNKNLDKLLVDMFSYYNAFNMTNYSTLEEAQTAIGKFCACKWSEDNHWYRAEVVDWHSLPGHVRVHFVDHGNSCSVPLDCIRPLAPQFVKLPICAQLCHLAQVCPAVKCSPWSEESIDFFKSKVIASNSMVYSVSVVPSTDKTSKSNSLAVLLYAGKPTDDAKSINEQMVESGLAWSKEFSQPPSTTSSLSAVDDVSSQHSSNILLSSGPSPPPRTTKRLSTVDDDGLLRLNSNIILSSGCPEFEVDFLDTWDPLKEDFLSSRNNPSRDTDDACVALTDYSAKDESRICQFFSRDGFCRKQHCTKEHAMPSLDGVTTDKEEVYSHVFSEMALPSVGQSVEVLVTAVMSTTLFYVQIPQALALDINCDDEKEETLDTLSRFMNQNENIVKMKYLKVAPAVAQLVLASWDGNWYRARVVGFEGDQVEVMFVDYGSQSIVFERDLRDMEPRYLHLPFQAVECSLANVEPNDKEDLTETFRSLVEGKRFRATVLDSFSCAEINKMELLLANEKGDIGDELIDLGIAEKKRVTWNYSYRTVKYYPG